MSTDKCPSYLYSDMLDDQQALVGRAPGVEPEKVPPLAFTITNKGAVIESSTYWGSAFEGAGAMFLSFHNNGGLVGARLLVPSRNVPTLRRELKGTRRVQLDLGRVEGGDPRLPPFGYRLIFDDGSDSPFFIFLGPGHYDGLIPETQDRTRLHVAVYGPGPRRLDSFPGFFQHVGLLYEPQGGVR